MAGIVRKIRWLALIPAALAGYYLAIFAGMGTIKLAEFVCPPDKLISDVCSESYMDVVHGAVFVIFPGLAAFLIVFLPVIVGPGMKKIVAIVAYICGGCIAVFMGLQLNAWAPLASSLSGGALAVWLVFRWLTPVQLPNQ